MADSDLPVFSFRPNWAEPMNERLSFLTDVLGTDQGVEQRRALRETPRRSFDAAFLLVEEERTFWDLFIDALGGAEVVAPLYWEVVTLTAALTATVTDRIEFDTTRREWTYHEGYLAILMGETALDYEVVEIASVDDTGVNLTEAPARAWPVGTKLYPLRRAVLEDVGEVRHPTAAVGTVNARLRIVGANRWNPAADDSPTYLSLPVMLEEPNWVDDLSFVQDREVALLDSGIGRTYQVDATGRVLLGQLHRWFLPGKEKLARFRDLLYRHRGRQGGFWLPTFKADLQLASSATSGATQIVVKNVGYRYTGGPRSGRQYIAIKHSSGTIIRRVLSVIAGTTPATERLNLDAPLGLALSPGQVRRISFADSARFDTDDFEIAHYGGIEGHHDAQAMFRTFRNTRTAPSPISFPIPVAEENGEPCGTFPWFFRVRIEWIGLAAPQPVLGFLADPEIGPLLSNGTPTSPTTNNYRIYIPGQSAELVWVTDSVPTGQQLLVMIQTTSGSLTAFTRARVSIRRYGEGDFQVVFPKAGSETSADSSGYFPLIGIFPGEWTFDI